MTPNMPSASEQAWALIEQEKRRDRFLRRVSFVAWTMTFLIVLTFGIVEAVRVLQMRELFGGADSPFSMSLLLGAFLPLLVVFGILFVLVATLSTVGMFLRMRTTSLAEIQMRLAALEELLTRKAQEQGETGNAP